jgi:hypothetical protein
MDRKAKKAKRSKAIDDVIPLSMHFRDLVENHPFEIGLSIALSLFGTRALITGLHTAPGSVQTLPLWLAILYCSLSVLGGVSVLAGLGLRIKVAWAYGLERFGLFVSASAWGAYILGLVLTPITGRSTLLILALLALCVGCILRSKAVDRKENATLNALRTAQLEKEDRS